jgi:hypothetical protein
MAANAYVWQYGQGTYLFTGISDARAFIRSAQRAQAEALLRDPRAPIKDRSTIVEVLLPKEEFDRLRQNEVAPALDWAVDAAHPQHAEQRKLRYQSDVLFGQWQEDPRYPQAAFLPLVGRPQVAIVGNTGAGSILDLSLTRIVLQRRLEPPRPSPLLELARELQHARRPFTVSGDKETDLPQRRGTLIKLLAQPPAASWTKLVRYLTERVPHLKSIFKGSSGTWEGYTIAQHTKRAYELLSEQLSLAPLGEMQERYGTRVDLERTLRLALILHDIGKAPALETSSRLILTAHRRGLPFSTIDRTQVPEHSKLSAAMIEPIMQQLGFNPDEVALATTLVDNHVLGRMLKGQLNMTGAADQLEALAAKTVLSKNDYFGLQSLFFVADAGSYPTLRESAFEVDGRGRLSPSAVQYQLLRMRFE